MPVAPERIIQVVGHDEEHIQRCRRLGRRGGAAASGQAKAGAEQHEDPEP